LNKLKLVWLKEGGGVVEFGRAHESVVWSMMLSFDKETVWTADWHGWVKEWSVREGKMVRDWGKVADKICGMVQVK
jgi:hypothetical protein